MPTQTSKKTTRKKNALAIDVVDTKGKKVGTVDLPREIFGAKANPTLVAQAVRVYLANKRQGTVSTKTRGEVKGSSRKIYRQKGTGRARHGSIRAPIFVHGGIVFGPKPRDFSLTLPQKMKRKALFSVLSGKLADDRIKILSNLSSIKPKTKEFVSTIDALSLNLKDAKILVVLPSVKGELEGVVRAIRNVEGVTYIDARQLNTYEVLDNNMLLFAKESLPVIEATFLKGKSHE